MPQASGRAWRFGPFRYDPEQRLLFRDAELVALAPKALDALHVLLERHGRIVSRSELLTLLWPDTAVEEIGLARNISLLRKALGDERESETYIETIPKRGYRFVAPVAEEGEQEAETAPAPSARRFDRRWAVAALLPAVAAVVIYWQFYRPSRYLPPAAVSLAVIPFEPIGSGIDADAWSAGLADVLAGELSNIPAVHVVSPDTVRRYSKAPCSGWRIGSG
jgi:DNA-binding winged helix-turn-helix (wHTH) protein